VVLPDNTDSKYLRLNLSNVFSMTKRFDLQSVAAANFLKAQNIKNFIVVHDDSSFARLIISRFTATARKFDIKSKALIKIDPKQANFTPLVNFITKSKPEYVFFAGDLFAGSALAKQIAAARLDTRILATNRMDSPQFAKFLGQNVEHVNYISLGGPAHLYPEAKSFSQEFAKRYGTRPGSFTAQAYDAGAAALKALLAAIKENSGKPPSRTQVINNLRQAKFIGASGPIGFGKRGERQEERYFIMQISSPDPSKWLENKAIYSINVR